MQIGDSRRPERSSRRRSLGKEEDEEVELGEGEKELSFPLSFIVFWGFLGGLPPSLPPTPALW